MGIGIKELLVILVVVIIIFGTKRLRNMGSDLGAAVKGFRKSMHDGEEESNDKTLPDNTETPASHTEKTTSDEQAR